MTNPLSRLILKGERAGGALLQHVNGGARASASPPPLPPQGAPAPALEPVGSDASRAPTLRPPSLAATQTPPSVPMPNGLAERRGSGFTSVIRHLSLRGWLHWIQWNRCDATLRVRTPDGGNGHIWCGAGTVVDAEWGALAPEQALHELLQLSSGAVSIDFDPVERPRRIAARSLVGGSLAGEPLAGEPLAAQPFAGSAARSAVRRATRGEYVTGGVLLAAAIAFAFVLGRDRGASDSAYTRTTEPAREQQTKAGLLPPPEVPKAEPAPAVAAGQRELSDIPFTSIQVEPAGAEIWLDQSLIALGRIDLAPMRDGVLHELRFVAAGHAPRSLYFLDSPPAGRVVLEPAAEPGAAPARALAPPEAADAPLQAAASAPAEAEPPSAPSVESRDPPRRVRRHAAPPAPARERPAADVSASSAKSAPSKKSPQVQLIEAHEPRVQVLE